MAVVGDDPAGSAAVRILAVSKAARSLACEFERAHSISGRRTLEQARAQAWAAA